MKKLAMFATALKKKNQVIDVERLLNEVERAELHRFDGVVDRAERRHHDHGAFRIALLGLFENGDAVGAGEPEIGDDGEIASTFGEAAHGVAAVRYDVRFEPFRLDR